MNLSTADRLCLFLTAATLGLALIFLADSARSTENPYPEGMCDSIAHELNNAYIEGFITEADARHVIESCFDRYHD